MNEDQMKEKIIKEAKKLAVKMGLKLDQRNKAVVLLAVAFLAVAGFNSDEDKEEFFNIVEQIYYKGKK